MKKKKNKEEGQKKKEEKEKEEAAWNWPTTEDTVLCIYYALTFLPTTIGFFRALHNNLLFLLHGPFFYEELSNILSVLWRLPGGWEDGTASSRKSRGV